MGAPVLLVHGFATSAQRTWVETGWTALLADAGRDVITPDLLGHGSAPRPGDPEAYSELEDHLAGSIGDGPVDAVGFSLGARTLLTLALRRPELFGRLVLGGVGEGLLRPDDGLRDRIVAALRGEAGDDVYARHFADLASGPDADREALIACVSHERPPFDPVALATLTVPCLVVVGEHDDQGPPGPLVDALGVARGVVVRGVDHFGLPKSFGFVEAALAFLDEAS